MNGDRRTNVASELVRLELCVQQGNGRTNQTSGRAEIGH
jgi:hypothetical protein